jgi:hypothetical protein
MGRYIKTLLCGVLVVILLSLNFLSGCGSKQQKTSDTGVFSTNELKSIADSGEASLSDDTPASILWVPKTQKATLSKVTFWLRNAQRYKGEIPQSQITGTINANVGPSVLYISTSDKHKITI